VSPLPPSSPIDFVVLFPVYASDLIASVLCSGVICNPNGLKGEASYFSLELRRAVRDFSDEGGRLQLGMTAWVEHAACSWG
jgi:hypothetical protein